jgi:hypothetical protein
VLLRQQCVAQLESTPFQLGDSRTARYRAWLRCRRRGADTADPVRAARAGNTAPEHITRIPLAHSYRLLVRPVVAGGDEGFLPVADMRDLHDELEFFADTLAPNTE